MRAAVELCTLHKRFRGGAVVADGLSAALPAGQVVALLGRNGAGKSTLLAMIAGTLAPDAGHVWRAGRISWPVGLSSGFHRDMTGAQNLRFIARVHGVEPAALVAFGADVSGLGAALARPVGLYSSGMRARLAFAASMGVTFDYYLVDELTAVGDGAFRARAEALLRARLAARGGLVVSHSMTQVRRLCSMGAVLDAGKLHLFSSVDAAIAEHERIAQVAGPGAGRLRPRKRAAGAGS